MGKRLRYFTATLIGVGLWFAVDVYFDVIGWWGLIVPAGTLWCGWKYLQAVRQHPERRG